MAASTQPAAATRQCGWRVLRRARVALLDLEFARQIAPDPEINGQLIARRVTVAITNNTGLATDTCDSGIITWSATN